MMVLLAPYSMTERLNLRSIPFLSICWNVAWIIMCCTMTFSVCFHVAKMELNDKNILNVLHKAEIADAHWELLGKQLIINRAALPNIRANRRGEANLCMIDAIAQWLRTDTEASWEKLAKAVAEVEEYGEATADIVRREAAIGKVTEKAHTHISQMPHYSLYSQPINDCSKMW